MSNLVLKNETQDQEHSGKLEHDSPGFFQFLSKTFPNDLCQTFERVYALIFENGKVELAEAQSDRAPRFNPAPCRVAGLLVSECQDRDPENLLAAMIVCLEEQELIRKVSDVSEEARKLAISALEFLKSPGSTSPMAERLGLALALDRIRHLHLSSKDSAGQISTCIETQRSLIPEARAPENEKLKLLLNAACTRLLRIRGQREADS